MTTPQEIWSSQLRIAAGRAVEEAPQVGFAEQVDQLGRLVRLSILAEPASDGADAFMDQFVRRIGELFNPAGRSLTGALKAAVQTTHEELRLWNEQHLPAEHAMYGLSCLIQRADQPAVLAQCGPSAAVLAGDAGLASLRAITFYAHRLRRDDPVAAPVGSSEPLNLEFAPATASEDGWAMLVTSNAAALLDAELRVQLSRLPVERTLPHLYPAMVQLRDAAALVVGVAGKPPLQSVSGGRQTEEEAPAEESDDPPEPGPADRVELPSEDQHIVTDTRRGTAGERVPESVREPRMPPEIQQAFRFEPVPVAAMETIGWPVNPFAAGYTRQLETLTPALSIPSGPVGAPILDLGRAMPSLLENRGEPAVERPRIALRDTADRAASARRAGIVLAAMLIVLAGVAAALLGPSLLQSEDDQFRTQVERARNGLAASELAATTEGARLTLQNALSDVEAALEINPLDADARQLRGEIEAVLAELNLVQPPGELNPVADLTRFGPAIALGAVRFGAGLAFVVDDAGGRVFSIAADGQTSVLFLEGELLGLGSQLRAGRPISIAWQPGPTTPTADDARGTQAGDALWILDSHARLFRWTPTGVLLVPIPELVRLGSVDAIAATSGSIYLLDRSGGAVWRFAVDRSELSEPSRAVGRTDLHGATEFVAVVNELGRVEFVVASSDGRVRRFSGDAELPLAIDLQRGLLAPASLSLGAESGLIYVVDRGQGRIVAVNPDSGVVSQIRSTELADLRGAWVNEQTGQIVYALSSSVLVGRLPGAQE
ncbi:MAG: hypothetical protein OXN86_08805 [Chloroflexota bacterium]|nr:hypothetical protein [Chloroflexota bacterium]